MLRWSFDFTKSLCFWTSVTNLILSSAFIYTTHKQCCFQKKSWFEFSKNKIECSITCEKSLENICYIQSPENIQIFLETTRTFHKFPTFFAIYITLFGLLCIEWVVQNVSELTFFIKSKEKFSKI